MADAAQSAANEMVASNQRPIPLRKRADLVVAEIDYLGVGYQVIKDPVALKYHRLQQEQYTILQLLDGERSLEQVRDLLKVAYPTLQVTLSDIQQLITDLYKKALLTSDRPGQGASVVRERRKEKMQKLKQTLMSLLYLRLPGWDPERTLRWMYPFLKWMFWKPVVLVTMLFVVSAWLVLGAQFDEFQSRLPEFQSFFGWPNLIYLWVTLGLAKVIHEFGHGLSCHHYGGECHEMGVMLLVFSPCLYCDVTDSWMMKNKWHRIIIGAAGMYIEVILSAIAIYVWWFTRPGMLHYLALNTFFVTTITTVIFNANPLMRFDGYYMMSDFLEIPNLRAKSEKMLREAFSWYCLGIESRPDPFMPETGRAWFITYAIAAWCYRWVILVSISMFLYTVLKPYDLQSLGITLCVFSMAGIVFGMFRNVYQIIATPRMEPMSKPKIIISLTVFVAVCWFIGTLPIPWHHQAPFLVEPDGVVHVTSEEQAGTLLQPKDWAKIHADLVARQQQANVIPNEIRLLAEQPPLDVIAQLPTPEEFSRVPQPGDEVVEDQIIVIIDNPEAVRLRDQLAGLFRQWTMHHDQIEFGRGQLKSNQSEDVLDAIANVSNSRAELTKLRSQMTSLVTIMNTRVIRAETAGTIVAAPRVPEPGRDVVNRTRLHRWHGTPLDLENTNCIVEPATDLCQIAPTSELQAVAYIDQSDGEDLTDNMLVELKLDHLPWKSFGYNLQVLSHKDERVAPEALTTKYGGTLATRPDDKGQETLTSVAYQGIIPLNLEEESSDAFIVKPGMRGRARFLVKDRTAFQWAKLYFYETFRFRL